MAKSVSMYLSEELLETIKNTKQDDESLSKRIEYLIKLGLETELESTPTDKLFKVMFSATKKLLQLYKDGSIQIQDSKAD